MWVGENRGTERRDKQSCHCTMTAWSRLWQRREDIGGVNLMRWAGLRVLHEAVDAREIDGCRWESFRYHFIASEQRLDHCSSNIQQHRHTDTQLAMQRHDSDDHPTNHSLTGSVTSTLGLDGRRALAALVDLRPGRVSNSWRVSRYHHW